MSYLPATHRQKCQQLLQSQPQSPRPMPSPTGKPSTHSLPQPSITNLQTIQYKNAIYFGKVSSNKHQQKSGIGIILYDNGDILVAEFSQDQVKGKFFYYQGRIGAGESANEDGTDGVCYYGSIDKNTQQIDGHLNMYHRNGVNVEVPFSHGCMAKLWYSKSNGSAMQHQNKLEAQVSNGSEDQQGQLTPRGKQYYLKPNHLQPSRLPNQIPTPAFASPTDFLSTHLSHSISTPQSSPQSHPTFQLYQISKTQTFYGIIDSITSKPQGYGIIFFNQWPVCYGRFIDGELNGWARVQQNRMLLLDGLFLKATLQTGWVVDLQDSMTSFGHLEQFHNGKGNQPVNKFKYKQQYTNIHIQKIVKFRRKSHIQSLTYTNSYILQLSKKLRQKLTPAQLEQHRNPKHHLNQQPPGQHLNQTFQNNYNHNSYSSKPVMNYLQIHNQQNYNTENFIPSFISEISRVDGTTPRSRIYVYNNPHQNDRHDGNSSSQPKNDSQGNVSNAHYNIKVHNPQQANQKQYQSDRVQRQLIELIKQYNENKSSFEKASKVISSRLKSADKTERSVGKRYRNIGNGDKEKEKEQNVIAMQDRQQQQQLMIPKQNKQIEQQQNKNKTKAINLSNKIQSGQQKQSPTESPLPTKILQQQLQKIQQHINRHTPKKPAPLPPPIWIPPQKQSYSSTTQQPANNKNNQKNKNSPSTPGNQRVPVSHRDLNSYGNGGTSSRVVNRDMGWQKQKARDRDRDGDRLQRKVNLQDIYSKYLRKLQ